MRGLKGSLGTRPHPTGLPGFYLKKHRARTWRTWLASFLDIAPPRSPGRIEAENAIALNSLGIGVMPLTGYGEKLRADGHLESFLISEELLGYCELQDFIEQWFSPAWNKRELRRLIAQVADIARRFHAAGFNHRDFYCCHFLVKETSPGQFDIRLIDLQRVQQRRWLRRRWIVKDLAQVGQHVARCTRRLPRESPFPADLSGRQEASAARQAVGPRSAAKTRLHPPSYKPNVQASGG